jgi:hypothetical protein
VLIVVVPVVFEGQFQEAGGVASGSTVIVAVVELEPELCVIAITCAEFPLVESAMLALPAT